MKSSNSIGSLMHIYLEEIEAGEGTNASDFLIKATAKALKEKGGRNWIPVIVKETGEDSYQVIGNSFIYAVADQAGLERVWCIIADDSDDTLALTKVLAGETPPKINLSTASRDEIMAALEYLIELPNSNLKGVKLAIATNRIDEAPRQFWKSLDPIATLKCGITKAKLDTLKSVFYLTPQTPPIEESKGDSISKQETTTKAATKTTSKKTSEPKISDVTNITKMTVPQLRELAKERGIIVTNKTLKADLIKLLS